MKVLIDNGHGENTPGKRSPDGRLREWAYTRKIADRVIAGLRTKGIDAERIVKEMVDIPLSVRCRRQIQFTEKVVVTLFWFPFTVMPQGLVRIGYLPTDGVSLFLTMLQQTAKNWLYVWLKWLYKKKSLSVSQCRNNCSGFRILPYAGIRIALQY